MVRELFPVEERMKSNVNGVLGKEQLNPEKLTLVKEATFQMFPCDVGEREDYAWRMCCKAIDESCHRFNKEREKLRKRIFHHSEFDLQFYILVISTLSIIISIIHSNNQILLPSIFYYLLVNTVSTAQCNQKPRKC